MADVPHRWDLTISDGSTTKGYVLYPGWTGGDSSNSPQKAIHSYSPTFVPRTNTQGNYGDDTEDFFMTFSQKDWSLGEQQKYSRASDETASRRYWRASGSVDITTPGQVDLSNAAETLTSIAALVAVCSRGNSESDLVAVGSSNLFSIATDGTVTDEGAHGVGDVPSRFGLCSDGSSIYISSNPSGAGVGIRRWTGSAFSTFSAEDCNSLEFLNNTLYGTDGTDLFRFSTAGTATSIFQWVHAMGAGFTSTESVRLRAFGGKLLILHSIPTPHSLLSIYDGVGVSLLTTFPANFLPYDMVVHQGIVFISGKFMKGSVSSASLSIRPALMYYANGNVGLLWQADDYTSGVSTGLDYAGSPPICVFDGRIIFTDYTTARLMAYNPATGGVQAIASYTTSTNPESMAASYTHLVKVNQTANQGFVFPDKDTIATSANITSALIDFDSSLDKLFRGIKIDYDEASDGDGGSVDIAYRVNDLNGNYTTLQTGAVSGTEYTLGTVGTPIEGRSISYKITLNKGTSTLGPVLKRVYVRAAPQVTQRHRGLYHINCTTPNSGSVITEDHTGSPIPRSGMDMVHELRDFADAGSLLTVTDPLHSFTAVVELLEITQVSSNEDPGYVVTLGLREV